MTTFQAWEHTSLFPSLGNRLSPTAKLVFHMGIAFVKYERVNNSISPECQFYEVSNALKTISNLEVVSPRERIIDCILKFTYGSFGLVSLFIIMLTVLSGNSSLAPPDFGASTLY